MQIRGTKIERSEVTIDVSPLETWRTLKNTIKAKFGIHASWFLKDDGWFYEDEDHYHGSISEIKVVEATLQQAKVYHAIKDLEKATDFYSL